MRQWHRWLALVFAPFLLWIAGTGLGSHIVPLWQRAAAAGAERPAPAAGVQAGFHCPETMICRPKNANSLIGTLHDLHSGKSFGFAGQIVSILSGCALLFFACSGMLMYWRMWRDRAKRGLRPRWFW